MARTHYLENLMNLELQLFEAGNIHGLDDLMSQGFTR